MSRQKRSYTQAFKLAAVDRMASGENVAALARELGVLRKCLYVWRDQRRVGGVEGLRPRKPGPKARGDAAAVMVSDVSPGEACPSALEPSAVPVSVVPDPLAAPGATPALADARAQIAALERKIGQQALDLDFFRAALRHFRATRRPSDGSGVPVSTRSSEP